MSVSETIQVGDDLTRMSPKVDGVSGKLKMFERGWGWKTIYQPHPHLLQMHTTRPFTRKKRLLGKTLS